MNRIDRLFGILTMLQARKFLSAEQIADQYSISIRTVYRDIKALNEQGVPVSFEPHRGYFIVPGYFLPPVSFTSDEANALLLMESMIKGFADASIQAHYTKALNKVRAVMHDSQKEKLEKLNANIKLQLPPFVKNDFAHLSTIQQAIAEQHIVHLEYRRSDGETSTRSVEPIGLIYYAFHWHMIGWCHRQHGYRDFRVSRIMSVRDTLDDFRKSDHMPLKDYMKHLPVKY